MARRGAARRGVEVTLAEDKWEVGGGHDLSGMGWLGSGAHSWALRLSLCCPAHKKGEMVIVSKDVMKS